MKLIYIAMINNLKTDIGVLKKIHFQVESLLKENINIRAYILYDVGETVVLKYISSNVTFIKIKNPGESLFNKLQYRKKKICCVWDILKHESYDYIYYRYNISDLYMLMLVRKLPNVIVFEHQTKELNEFYSKRLIPAYCSEYIFGSYVRKYAKGIIGVTNEITEYQKKRCRHDNIKATTISNGISVKSFLLRRIPVYDGHHLNLLFVGNISEWHGLDRLIRGIYEYKGNKQIKLFIVGDGHALNKIKYLVKYLSLENKVIFKGYITGNYLDEMYDYCHIAIGSLAIHRSELVEASPLKTREYCARGIPFIIGYKDVDLNDDRIYPYIWSVKPDDSAINIEDICAFASKVYMDDQHNISMRNWANDYLDIRAKARSLKAFLENLDEDKS